MTTYLKTIPLAVFLGCCLISGCTAQDKPGTDQGKARVTPGKPAADQPAAAQPATAESAPPPSHNIFQPSAIDPALVRQSMQARSAYEEMNRKVTARMNTLYEENPEIKELQARMRELQKRIDALLAEDEELANLKKKAQTIAPEIPTIPRKAGPPISPNQGKPQKP